MQNAHVPVCEPIEGPAPGIDYGLDVVPLISGDAVHQGVQRLVRAFEVLQKPTAPRDQDTMNVDRAVSLHRGRFKLSQLQRVEYNIGTAQINQ